MKITYNETDSPKPPLPQVGDVWKHSGCNEFYMRIADEDGKKIFPNLEEYFFYSINLEDASFCYTDRNARIARDEADIVILDAELVLTHKTEGPKDA